MQSIKYRIISLSPLVFASNTGDPNMVATLDYIPGTYLRGMFANEYIKKKNLHNNAHKDNIFYEWFLLGNLKITNAYIIDGNKSYFPIPLSIQQEKGKDEIYDLLLQDENFDKQTKGIEGYGRFNSTIYRKTVKKHLNFHHARNRERGVSKEGLIFNYESINEGQTFEGYIIGDANDLKEFIKIIPDGIYYLGRSRNSQYGKVKFEIIDNKEPKEFSSEIQIEIESSTDKIVLTLLSDTIIYNEYGFSTTNISDLEKFIGCKVEKAFIKQTDEEGFISIWRLKTPSEVCFNAGSCFLFYTKDDDIKRLKELQKTGIGLRTHEGFGRFVIGLQKEEKGFSITSEEKPQVIKPKTNLPEDGKRLMKNIIRNILIRNQQHEAMKMAEDFRNLPPKSLLSKLETLVRDGKIEEFLKKNNIKKTARDNLEKCRDKNKTLFDHLKDPKIDIWSILNNRHDIRNLCDEISYKISDIESEYGNEIKKRYLTALLSTMRKIAKQKGGQ
jgi:CRISPR-associated protein Csx10